MKKAYLETWSLKGNYIKKVSAAAYRQQPQSSKNCENQRWQNLKGGYSSDASLVYQSWLKDIWVYTLEHHLSQQEAIQLVKDYTSEQPQVT